MGKFRIKISSSWFSKDHVILKYTTNGIFWKSIKCYDYNIEDNWCYISTRTMQKFYPTVIYLLIVIATAPAWILLFTDKRSFLTDLNNENMRAKEFLDDYAVDDLNVFGRHEEHYSLDDLIEEYAND